MKLKNKIFSVAALIVASTSFLNAQTAASKPVGVRTETIRPGFNLISPNLVSPVLVSSDVDSAASTTIGETDIDLTTILSASSKYYLTLVSGPNTGINTEISAFTSNSVTTIDNISSLVVANDTKYEIRKATTLADLFGATNTAGLKSGNANTADRIWVPKGNNQFDVYYHTTTGAAGWRKVGVLGAADQSANIVYFSDAIFVERQPGSTPENLTLTFTGHVLSTGPKVVAEANVNNYISRSLPVDITLDQLGIKSQLFAGNANTADRLWVPDAAGGYSVYYVTNSAGTLSWRKVGVLGAADQGSNFVKSGFILERKQPTNVQLTLPIPTGFDI